MLVIYQESLHDVRSTKYKTSAYETQLLFCYPVSQQKFCVSIELDMKLKELDHLKDCLSLMMEAPWIFQNVSAYIPVNTM